MRLRFMTRASLLAAITVLSAIGSAALAQMRPSTTMARPATTAAAATPVPSNLQAFTNASVCQAHPEVANCAPALSRGMVLFTWGCPTCDRNWSAVFVVNGQPEPAGNIELSKSKLSALSVRANQFKPTDCVAVRVFNPANAAQEATSGAVCMSRVLTAHTTVPQGAAATAAVAAAPAMHPMGGPGPHPAPGAGTSVPQSAKGTGSTAPYASSAVSGTLPSAMAGSTVHGSRAPRGTTKLIANPNYVPAPSGMTATQDQQACSSHGGFGGGLACAAALPAGQLALVWNCSGCKMDKVNGYHLYRVDVGQHALLPANGAYSSDGKVTLALLEPPDGGFTGKCYAVTAYRGSNESSMSNAYCAAGGSTMAAITLQPQHALHWTHARSSRTGTLGHSDKPYESYDATPMVGYADHYWNNEFGDIYDDAISRTGVYFDLTPLAGRTVVKAVLQFDAYSSWHDFDNTSADAPNLTAQSPEACVVSVDKATDHWWQNDNLSSTVAYVSPGPFVGPTFNIDVTSAIQNWVGMDKASNFGFVLRGGDENDLWHGNSNHVCLTQLNSVALLVTYH